MGHLGIDGPIPTPIGHPLEPCGIEVTQPEATRNRVVVDKCSTDSLPCARVSYARRKFKMWPSLDYSSRSSPTQRESFSRRHPVEP